MNECGACGRDFSSVEAFDAHRVGKHAYTYSQGARFDPPVEDGRRCLDHREIAGRFTQDERGRLTLASRVGRAKAAFSQ